MRWVCKEMWSSKPVCVCTGTEMHTAGSGVLQMFARENLQGKPCTRYKWFPLEILEIPGPSPGPCLLVSFPQSNIKLMSWITPTVKGDTGHRAAPWRIKSCFLTPPVSVGIVIPGSTGWLGLGGRAASKGYGSSCHFSVSVISLDWQGELTVLGRRPSHRRGFGEPGSCGSQKERGPGTICLCLPSLSSESATTRRLHHLPLHNHRHPTRTLIQTSLCGGGGGGFSPFCRESFN